MAGVKRKGKRSASHASHADDVPSAKRQRHLPPATRTPSHKSINDSPVDSGENEAFSQAATTLPRGKAAARGRGRIAKPPVIVGKSSVPLATHCFKNPLHKSSGKVGSKKPVWKSLKQIVATERALPWKADDPTYSGIEAPPSLKPVKKYADMSGLETTYTDPSTKLRYASSEEFQLIRTLPPDIVQGYLALRGVQLTA